MAGGLGGVCTSLVTVLPSDTPASKALLGGVPLLLLPTQAEQFLQARQLERVGLGINAAQRPRPLDYVATIGPMLRESAWRIAARAFARAGASRSLGSPSTAPGPLPCHIRLTCA